MSREGLSKSAVAESEEAAFAKVSHQGDEATITLGGVWNLRAATRPKPAATACAKWIARVRSLLWLVRAWRGSAAMAVRPRRRNWRLLMEWLPTLPGTFILPI